MSEQRVVILGPGPGAYEGLERPSLGDEVPEATRARARELEAATDIAGLRRLVTELARDGIVGYDVVALGPFAGTAWDFLGADVELDGRSALLQSDDWSDRVNEHGLLSSRADADAVLAAVGGGEIVPVRRLRRSAIRPGDRIWYTIGNEHSPGDPFGRIVLTIEADGTAVLELYSREGNGVWTGQVAPDVVARIRSELTRPDLPEIPRDPIIPGSAIRHVEVVTGDKLRYATMTADEGDKLDGYKQAFALLDSVAVQLSGGAYRGAPDTLEGPAVTDVRRLS